jgi:hypothetical protein
MRKPTQRLLAIEYRLPTEQCHQAVAVQVHEYRPGNKDSEEIDDPKEEVSWFVWHFSLPKLDG